MSEFESTVCGIPCIIRVTDYEHYRPAFVSGPPENCYPSEGGCGDWEVLDRRGRPAPWLERKLTDRERNRIDDEVFEHMELMQIKSLLGDLRWIQAAAMVSSRMNEHKGSISYMRNLARLIDLIDAEVKK